MSRPDYCRLDWLSMDSFLAIVLLIDDYGSLSYSFFSFFFTDSYDRVTRNCCCNEDSSQSNNFVSCMFSDFNKIIFVNMHLLYPLFLLSFLFSYFLDLFKSSSYACRVVRTIVKFLVLFFLLLFYFKDHVEIINHFSSYVAHSPIYIYDRNENSRSNVISYLTIFLKRYTLQSFFMNLTLCYFL